MTNPYRGEAALKINGETVNMKLTLGALASLEAELESCSLVDLVGRFETGSFAAGDLVRLLTAGLQGGGCPVSADDVRNADIEGGPIEAAKAAARLLKVTFSLPGE